MSVKQITLIAQVPDDWSTDDVEEALEQAFMFTNHSEDDFQLLWVNAMEDVEGEEEE